MCDLLIQTIDREDEWFMKEKKKDNANIFICSRHYSNTRHLYQQILYSVEYKLPVYI
ncbi:hypothetical protein ACOMHN_014689 [Nucella lapillus]